MKKVGLENSKISIEIESVPNWKDGDFNGKPQLKVIVKDGSMVVSNYLCDSIVVGDTEYFSEYLKSEWEIKNLVVENGIEKIRLPNGSLIEKDDFRERFFGENSQVLN